MPNIRDESFIPLTLAAPEANRRSDQPVSILPQAANVQAFRPLPLSTGAQTPTGHGPGCEPRVTVQRDGDRVSSIQIHCACGQLIELACVYEPPPAKPA